MVLVLSLDFWILWRGDGAIWPVMRELDNKERKEVGLASEYTKSSNVLGCCLWDGTALLEHTPIQVFINVALISCSESRATHCSPGYPVIHYVA